MIIGTRHKQLQHRAHIVAIVLGVWLAVLVVAPRALAQLPAGYNPCWTQTDCRAANGLWGKDIGEGQTIDAGESAKRGCKNTSTNQETAVCWNPSPNIPLEIGIPGVTDKFCSIAADSGNYISCSSDPGICSQKNGSKDNLGTCRSGITGGFGGYLRKFYTFFVAFLAVAAVTMTTWGGFKRIMAAGSAERIKDANDVIFKAIIGLVLALISYALLNLVNPKLVTLTGARLEKIKSQTFGDWCQVDLKKTNGSYVACNEEYQDPDTGYICRGQRCEITGTGCYAVSYNKDTAKVGYECKQPFEACGMINDDNIGDIAGVGTGNANDYLALDRICNNYSDTNGQCTWVEHGTVVPAVLNSYLFRAFGNNAISATLDQLTTAAALPISATGYAINSLFSSDDKCEYYSNNFQQAYCKGINFGGFDFTGQEKKHCADLNNSLTNMLGGTEWAACAHNWCKTINSANWQDSSCVPVWFSGPENWQCQTR